MLRSLWPWVKRDGSTFIVSISEVEGLTSELGKRYALANVKVVIVCLQANLIKSFLLGLPKLVVNVPRKH